MLGTVSRLLVAGLCLLLLTSCGSSVPGQLTNLEFPNVETVVTGAGVAFGVAFAMLDAAEFGGLSTESVSAATAAASLSTQSVTEVDDGLYLGMLSDVDTSGNTTLNLPDPADIPAATLVPAAQAFLLADAAPACTVVAAPASVRMSSNVFIMAAFPGFWGLIMDSSGGIEVGFGVVSDRALDTTSPPSEFVAYQWIYSDGQAVVSFDGIDCDGYSASQVDFREGWNLVGWNVSDIFTVDANAELVNIERPKSLVLNINSPVAP